MAGPRPGAEPAIRGMTPGSRHGGPVLRMLSVRGTEQRAVLFPYRRRRAALMVVGSLVFVLIGAVFAIGSILAIPQAASMYASGDRAGVVIAIVWELFLLLLGLATVGFFGLAGIAWIVTAAGRCYVALTAEALVVHDFTNRTVVPWESITMPRFHSLGTQRLIAVRFRKGATVRVTRRARWLSRANRHLRFMGLGDADIWISANSVAASQQLVQAIRWHKRAPHNAEALIRGYDSRWEGADS